MPRRRLLLVAYACEPGRGSEPGIGWNVARELAAHHDVWVLTDAQNTAAVEAAEAVEGLTVVPFAPPSAERVRLGGRGWGYQFHYPLWMRAAAAEARRLHDAVGFDATQHVTYNRYWMPSAAALDGVPFLWGPVGGGEGAPASFWREAGFTYEATRLAARAVFEATPGVRRTASAATIALGTTPESAARMRAVGARDVRVLPAVALSDDEIARLGHLDLPPADAPLRLVSIGRLLDWKGFHLGLRAFARAVASDGAMRRATYDIIGDGPAMGRLQREAAALHLGDRVRFLGALPREETLARLGEAHALVHPSLHDSGGFVCLEALAAGRPVLALATGGPAVLTPPEAGVLAPLTSPRAAVETLAEAMRELAVDRRRVEAMGEAGRAHVAAHHRWSLRAQHYARLHEAITRRPVAMSLPSSALAA